MRSHWITFPFALFTHTNECFFFSFLGKQTRGLGFYAMRKCNITFFYFLLHVILPCFLYVTHRRKIKIQTLSLSLSVSELLSAERPIGFELTLSKWLGLVSVLLFCSIAGEDITAEWAVVLDQVCMIFGPNGPIIPTYF